MSEKAPTPTKVPGASGEQTSRSLTGNFKGTTNPRHLRALPVLLRRPILRKELDHIAGCTNSPELIAELRRRGLEIPCDRIDFIDRDGFPCKPGVYSLTDADRRKVRKWMQKGGA